MVRVGRGPRAEVLVGIEESANGAGRGELSATDDVVEQRNILRGVNWVSWSISNGRAGHEPWSSSWGSA